MYGSATQDRQSTLLTRPLQLLYPLEIDTEKPEVPSEDVCSSRRSDTIVPESNKRVVRAAAKKSSQRTRAWIQELQSQE